MMSLVTVSSDYENTQEGPLGYCLCSTYLGHVLKIVLLCEIWTDQQFYMSIIYMFYFHKKVLKNEKEVK